MNLQFPVLPDAPPLSQQYSGDRITLRCCRAEQYEIGDENVFFFFNPFSEKVFEGVLRRLVQRERGTLICYYPSEAYVTWLNLTPEVEHIDTIDCRDLFNGNDERERLEIFRLRETESIG